MSTLGSCLVVLCQVGTFLALVATEWRLSKVSQSLDRIEKLEKQKGGSR